MRAAHQTSEKRVTTRSAAYLSTERISMPPTSAVDARASTEATPLKPPYLRAVVIQHAERAHASCESWGCSSPALHNAVCQ